MAGILFAGFETGSLMEGSSATGTFAFTSVNPVSGSYSFRANPTGTGVGYITFTGMTTNTGLLGGWNAATSYAAFEFRADALPASGTEPLAMIGTGAAVRKIELRISSGGVLSVYDQAGALVATGTRALAVGEVVQIGIKCGTGASASYEIRINGVTELSGTADLLGTNGGAMHLGKFADRNGQSVDFYFDNVAVDDAAFFPVGVRVRLARANANGSTMQWTAGTGASDYTQIDEVPPDDADYVQSTAENDVALFDFESAAQMGVYGTQIWGVVPLMRVKRAGGANSLVAVRLRSGSTNSDKSSQNATGSFGIRAPLYEFDPSTGAAWTLAGIDEVEAGIVDVDTAGDRCQLSSVLLSVLFTPSKAPPPPPYQLHQPRYVSRVRVI